MDPIRNPYTPGAGSRPPALTGRDRELESFRILLERLKRGKPEKSMLITGIRGVGKTVLINTFESIAEAGDFRTATAEITHESEFGPLIVRLARRALLSLSARARMKDRAVHAAAVLKSFTLRLPEGPEIGIEIEPLAGRADSGDLAEDLADVLVALGEAAGEQEKGVAFLLDEVQFLKQAQLEAVIAALHQVAQRGLPLTLVGAGLPQLPALTGAAKSYSERLFDFPTIGPLDQEAASEALARPAEEEGARFEEQAVGSILEFTEGYPYFLQEFGKHVWNLADGPTITVEDVQEALPIVRAQLDDNFFRVRAARVTRSELRYLAAMADMGQGPYRSGEIATKLGKQGPERVAPTRSRLIQKGLVFSPSHGLNEFTVPQFDDFLRRKHPFEALDQPPG